MSTLLVQSGTFDNIADAIRAKTGKVASMTPLEMPQEIASISGGGEGVTILSGTSNPLSSQGKNRQEFLKYIHVESDLEYITSTGNADLHIGITGKKSRKFVLKCNIHGGGGYACPIGARFGVGSGSMLLFYKYSGGNNAKYDVANGENAFGDVSSYYDKVVTITLSNDEVRLEDENGNFISQTPTNTNEFESPEMCLMNLGVSGGGSYGSDCACYMDIYECKIYENNVLIKSLLPKTNSNNEIGLVDMLSGTFYKANGTVSGTSRTTPISENFISNAFLKVSGSWQSLIGSNIADIDLGGGQPTEYTIEQGQTTSTSTSTASLTQGKYYLFDTVYGGQSFSGADIIVGNTSIIYTTSGIGRTGCIIKANSSTITYGKYGNVSDNEYTELSITNNSDLASIDSSWSNSASISSEVGKFYFLALADGETGSIVGASVLVEHKLQDTVSNGTRFLIVKATSNSITLDSNNSFYYRKIGIVI